MKKFLSLFVLFVLFGCNSKNEEVLDTATSGQITMSVDETFAPIIKSEIDTFEKLYPDAKIKVRYTNQIQAFEDLMADSSRAIIVARPLNEEELSYFKKLDIIPHVVKVCYDAIAIIVNKQNSDTAFTMEQLKKVISGEITNWNQINPKSNLGALQTIFDNSNSSTYSYLKERFSNELSNKLYAVKDNEQVIEYVTKNKGALGVIGVNWISDFNDTTVVRFLESINVVGIKSDLPNVDPKMFYKPYQAYIALKHYPLFREVYLLSREARTGLATGFTAFIASDKGQRIFLKSGLVPATMPIRLIETYNEQL
ncbi:MAG: substrate-binding domain-containing protein [bacterium]